MNQPRDLVGQAVGTYRVEALLGRGGMGEVYRAHDTKLNRPVAIKLLGGGVAADADRVRRFRAEARAVSSLNHPHILVIHDVGDLDGDPFIVTELIEGTTVRELLERHAVTLRDALDIGRQVAGALAAAHARGVVHCDIKPENVMVRPDGYVKVLDFGLATLVPLDVRASEATTAASAIGTFAGTPQYMSPEQAAGKRPDPRADQFSFGAMMYELVTGVSPFKRVSPVLSAAAVLAEEPEPLARRRPDLPPPVRWTIERCLAKNPDQRYASTTDLVRDLATVHERIADAPQPAAPLAASNLPEVATALIGRADEVQRIRALLTSEAVRWVTLTGPAGVGKTRLALQMGRELAPAFGGAVHYVALADVADPALVASAAAQALDVRPSGGESALAAMRRALLAADRPLLLIVDNFEHVLSAAIDVGQLLERCPLVKVLVTSRARVNISLEREFPVAPLATPKADSAGDPATVEAFPAVALFVQRAVATRPDFRLTAETAPAVAELARALDGLPLALELAATHVRWLPVQDLAARSAARRLSLAGGPRDRPSRQQTLRAAIEWSYQLLSEVEQRLFRRLSVFAGGWTLEAAEAVANAREDLGVGVFEGIASLVDNSLVVPAATHGAEPRFTMLATLREYASEQLETSGDAAITRRAHAAYCLVLAEEGHAAGTAAEEQWLGRCDVEHPNLRAALEWLAEAAQIEWSLRLASALAPYWHQRAHLAEGRDRLLRALALGAADEFLALRVRATFLLGTIVYSMGDVRRTADIQQGTLGMFRRLNDRNGMAASLNGLGLCYSDLHEFAEARRHFEEAMAIWQDLGDGVMVARVLVNLAGLASEEGDLAGAIARYREARAASDRAGDRGGSAWTLNFEAAVEHARGDPSAALALFGEARTRFQAIGDRWGETDALIGLGVLAGEGRRGADARQLLATAHTLSSEIGDVRGTVRVLEAAARLGAVDGDDERALRLAGAAAALRERLNLPLPRSQADAMHRLLDAIRQRLETQAASAAWMDGWTMPAADAVVLALGGR